MICANRHIKDAYNDLVLKRLPIDIGRELRWSPRTREEVDLALAAIKAIYQYIDGVDRQAIFTAGSYVMDLCDMTPLSSRVI